MNQHIPIHTETRPVEANGWVQAGDYHTAMFDQPQPPGVKGCPLGRSQVSMQDAIADLAARTNAESGTRMSPGDFIVTRHNGQHVAPAGRELVLRQDMAGQFQYQTRENGQPLIPWQYGGFDRDATIAQARDRFSFDHVAGEPADELSGFQTPLPPHDPARWQTTDGFDDGSQSRTNGIRAEEAAGMLPPSLHLTDPENLADVITNLLRHAHSLQHDPLELLDSARRNFLAEAGPLPLITDH